MLPDMKITMPVVGGREMGGQAGAGGVRLAGQSSAVLHELKIISSSHTRYRPSWERRAVDMYFPLHC